GVPLPFGMVQLLVLSSQKPPGHWLSLLHGAHVPAEVMFASGLGLVVSHKALAQSLAALQPLPFAHVLVQVPPQSESVSVPSCLLLVQPTATQLPASSHTVPPLSLQVAPLAASCTSHLSMVQIGVLH